MKKNDDQFIQAVTLLIRDKLIELTPEEARSLYGELHAMYGNVRFDYFPPTITTDRIHIPTPTPTPYCSNTGL